MIHDEMVTSICNLLEFRDVFDNEHIERIECFLRALVEEMLKRNLYTGTLRFWNMELFFQSAALHDVGKIAVRDSILLKPDKLTSEEFDEIKSHTLYGEYIINKVRIHFPESRLLTQAQIIAGTHHERWDGSGYPRQLAGDHIPIEGRLVAIADVFDTLVSERTYKKASSVGDALRIIKEGRGSHFDPQITDAFIAASRHMRPMNHSRENGFACNGHTAERSCG